MTDRASEQEAAAKKRRLDDAREVYRWIFKALTRSLESLEKGTETQSDAKQRQDLFRLHVRQLQTVFDLEGDLEKLGKGQGGVQLDLDAARDEIRERLSRIRECGGG